MLPPPRATELGRRHGGRCCVQIGPLFAQIELGPERAGLDVSAYLDEPRDYAPAHPERQVAPEARLHFTGLGYRALRAWGRTITVRTNTVLVSRAGRLLIAGTQAQVASATASPAHAFLEVIANVIISNYSV